MTHDIKNNKYDVTIVDEKIKDEVHFMTVETYINGEKYEKQFNFSHAQTPGGRLNSYKKHIRNWIDKVKEEDDDEHIKAQEKEKEAINVEE